MHSLPSSQSLCCAQPEEYDDDLPLDTLDAPEEIEELEDAETGLQKSGCGAMQTHWQSRSDQPPCAHDAMQSGDAPKQVLGSDTAVQP